MQPKSQSKIEMVDVEAKKPDDIVDEENSFRAKLAAQLVVNKKEQDIKDGEYVPPDHCGVGDLEDYAVIWESDLYLAFTL